MGVYLTMFTPGFAGIRTPPPTWQDHWLFSFVFRFLMFFVWFFFSLFFFTFLLLPLLLQPSPVVSTHLIYFYYTEKNIKDYFSRRCNHQAEPILCLISNINKKHPKTWPTSGPWSQKEEQKKRKNPGTETKNPRRFNTSPIQSTRRRGDQSPICYRKPARPGCRTDGDYSVMPLFLRITILMLEVSLPWCRSPRYQIPTKQRTKIP